MRFAGADVFADQMRLGHRHVKFGRRLVRISGRVFNDETFLALLFQPLRRGSGQLFPPVHQPTPDASREGTFAGTRDRLFLSWERNGLGRRGTWLLSLEW